MSSARVDLLLVIVWNRSIGMTSYYGDKSSQVPSWDAFDADDDQDIVDNSEVGRYYYCQTQPNSQQYAYAARDHVLFCIDAGRSMQTPRPDTRNEGGIIRGKSALQQVLEAVADLERKKVITGPADSVGVVLWNVDVSTGLFIARILTTRRCHALNSVIQGRVGL